MELQYVFHMIEDKFSRELFSISRSSKSYIT
jgi:hypothetical protein